MEGLRWILLGIGAVLLLLVYIAGRERRSARSDLFDEEEDTPSPEALDLHSVPEPDDTPPESLREELRELSGELREEARERRQDQVRAERAQRPKAPAVRKPVGGPAPRKPAESEMVVILHVAAHAPHRFTGQDITRALQAADLRLGAMDIYHRSIEVGGRRRDLVGVANMIEPGTLREEDLQDTQTPGLTLILQLPAAIDNLQAFDILLDCARRLAATLDAEVLDETRSTLTQQAAEHLRERIRDFTLKSEWPSD